MWQNKFMILACFIPPDENHFNVLLKRKCKKLNAASVLHYDCVTSASRYILDTFHIFLHIS